MEGAIPQPKKEVLSGAFFWLTAFYVVYCGRPADFLPFLNALPLAKITAVLTLASLVFAAGRTPRKFKDLPREASFLLGMVALFFVGAVLSPVWKGGAFFGTLDFAKVYVAWVLTFLLITTLARLKRIIFLQSVSVALISFLAIARGRSVPRLEGVVGGFYSNPNDMAFAIVLSLPFCLAFFLTTKNVFKKALWAFGMLGMMVALVLTASRAGFIDLVIAGAICLWYFGVKGKRLYLIVGTAFLATVLMFTVGGRLMQRFSAISGQGIDTAEEATARASYEERRELMLRALDAIAHYPVLGVGLGDFVVYSGMWKEVHASYLQVGADGGIPILILYLLFFSRGFRNLRELRRAKDLDSDTNLFAGALISSLVGFIVGACFAPEAYQYFPYFTVCYTSVFLAITKERAGSEVIANKTLRTPMRRFAQA